MLIIRFLKTGIGKNSSVLFFKNNALFPFSSFLFSVEEYSETEEY